MLWSSRILLILLVVHMLTRLFEIIVGVSVDMLIMGFEAGVIDDNSSDELHYRMSWMDLALKLRRLSWIPLVPAWWTWAVLCNRLARERGLALSHRPLAAIGWWFVPIANLIVPLRMVSELWQASVRPEPVAWREVTVSRVVPAWWLCFLAMLVVRIIVLLNGVEMVVPAANADVLEIAGIVRGFFRGDMVQQGVGIFAASLALVVVHQISTGLRGGERHG